MISNMGILAIIVLIAAIAWYNILQDKREADKAKAKAEAVEEASRTMPLTDSERDDVLKDGAWQQFFTTRPEPLTEEETREWLAQNKGVCLGSDAFFPFGDNVERARKSGVSYIAEPGGSIRDDNVIETADKYNMVMSFTGMRLFHH